MNLIRIAWKNAWNKKGATSLTLILVAFGVGILSMMLLLDKQLSDKLNRSIKDVDFVLGAKGSPLQLILSSVYHIDAPTGNIKVSEAQRIIKNISVKEAIPLAYGDNFQGWRIVGTTKRYSEFYEVKLREGKLFENPFEVTVGSYAAEQLNLSIGSTFTSTHGLDTASEDKEHEHEQKFTVVGIYESSGTAIDRLILTPVESVWMVHEHEAEEHSEEGHETGHHEDENAEIDHTDHEGNNAHKIDSIDHLAEQDSNQLHEVEHEHEAEGVSGEEIMKRVQERNAAEHNEHEDEREVTAYLIIKKLPSAMWMLPNAVKNTSMQLAQPAIEINRLNENFGIGMSIVKGVAVVIMLVSMLSVFISLISALRERKYDLAILRTLGARRWQVFLLVLLEGLLYMIIGIASGLVLSRIGLMILSNAAQQSFHDEFNPYVMLNEEYILAIIVLGLGVLASLLPAVKVFFLDISKTLSNEK
jgi:putative ABC transport system permease protein